MKQGLSLHSLDFHEETTDLIFLSFFIILRGYLQCLNFIVKLLKIYLFFFGHVAGGDPSSLNLGHNSETLEF